MFLVIAVLALAAFVIMLVVYLKRPAPDEQYLRAIDDANAARRRADAAEEAYRSRADKMAAELDTARKIPDERERFAALAKLANKLRGGR